MLRDLIYENYIEKMDEAIVEGIKEGYLDKLNIGIFAEIHEEYFNCFGDTNQREKIQSILLKKNPLSEDLPENMYEYCEASFWDSVDNVIVDSMERYEVVKNMIIKENQILQENKNLMRKNKALEDIIVNLILVNNEYKRQIEGL